MQITPKRARKPIAENVDIKSTIFGLVECVTGTVVACEYINAVSPGLQTERCIDDQSFCAA